MGFLTLQQQIVPDWNWGGSTAKLRVFASEQFFEADTGAMIPRGSVNNIHSACQIYDCSVIDTDLLIPQVTVATTTDSTSPTATYTFILYDAQGVRRYTMLSQAFVDPSYFQVPPQSNVVVSDAGTVASRGVYTYRGQSNGKPYYNLETYSDSTTENGISWDGNQWNITASNGDVLYYSFGSTDDYPWEVSVWSYDAGGSPLPVVTEGDNSITSTWEQLTLSNQASATVGAPFQFAGPFWNVAQTKQYVNSLVGTGTTPFSSSLTCGKVFLSEDPVLPQVPIAIGTNDPHWNVLTTAVKWLTPDYDNDLNAAVADIGSTPTTLMITETTDTVTGTLVIPSTLRLEFVSGGVIDGGAATITIGAMNSPPPVKIFNGGTIHLAKNAVPEKNLSWWAGNSNGSPVSDEFNQMTYNGGRCFVPAGTWEVRSAQVPSYTLIRGAGNGTDGTTGTVLQSSVAGNVLNVFQAFRHVTVQDLTLYANHTNTVCFSAVGVAVDGAGIGLYFKNVTFYGTASTSPQFYLADGGGAWQCEEVVFDHCEWTTPAGGRSYQCDSVNTSVWMVNGCIFGVGANADAIYGNYVGFMAIIGAQFAGVGLSAIPYSKTLNRTVTASITFNTTALTLDTGTFSNNDVGQLVAIAGKLNSYITEVLSDTEATVADVATATASGDNIDIYKWTASTARGGSCVRLINAHGNVNLITCVDEGMSYFFRNQASTYIGSINIENCWPQSWISLEAGCTLNLTNNRLFSLMFKDSAAVSATLFGNGNYQDNTGVIIMDSGSPGTMAQVYPWNIHDGSSIFYTKFDNEVTDFTKNSRQHVGGPTTFNYGMENAGSPDTTNGFVTITASPNATGGSPINLLRVGVSDEITELPTYYTDLYRDFTTGYWHSKPSQVLPYKGYNFEGAVEAGIFRGGSVNAPQITNDGQLLNPGEYKRMVRMSSNANHTVGGWTWNNYNNAGLADDEVVAINVGTHNITFLNQDAFTTANLRFITSTNLDLVIGPNEIVRIYYDATISRNRVAKLNVTGLYDDGDRVFVNSTSGLFVGQSLQVGVDVDIASALTIGGGDPLTTSTQTGSGDIVMSASPGLTGMPTAPTQSLNTANTTLATTDFVGVLRSYLASSVTYNNNATPANTALSLTLAASTKYKVELTIYSTNAVKALSLDFGGTATFNNVIGQWTAYLADGSAQVGAQVSAVGTDFAPATMDANTVIYTFNGTVDVNAGGTLVSRGCQRTADISNTVITKGSSMVITKLS